MRLHTDSTLDDLENITTQLGSSVRLFKKRTCAEWKTFELPREARARARREHRQAQKAATVTNTEKDSSNTVPTTGATQSKPKPFNDSTYKLHRLPDYPRTIRHIGTYELFSAQRVREFSLDFQLTSSPWTQNSCILSLFPGINSSKPHTENLRTRTEGAARTTSSHS